MSRCGCEADCNCAIVDGDCTEVAGSGTIASPYTIGVVVDPDPDNLIECGPSGLLAEQNPVVVADTDCIDLEGDGSAGDPLTATPIISADPDNLLSCAGGIAPFPGLLATVETLDGSCVDFSGAGTVGDPLTADPIISPDVGNTFECRANGVFVPVVGVGSMPRATIEMIAAQPVPASAGAGIPAVVSIDYDSIVEDTSAFVTVSGGGSFEFTIPAGLEGFYLLTMQERDTTASINLGTSVGIQIRVNGIVEASERFERVFGTQKILNISRGILLAAGDLITGFFNITSTAGATAPHSLGPGGAGLIRFLQLTRLSPP